jgi:hypothetical protein
MHAGGGWALYYLVDSPWHCGICGIIMEFCNGQLLFHSREQDEITQ